MLLNKIYGLSLLYHDSLPVERLFMLLSPKNK